MSWIDYRKAKPISYQRKHIADLPAENIVTISADESRKLKEGALAICKTPYNIEEQDAFINAAKALTHCFAPETVASVESILATSGVVLMKGLPVEADLPDTPTKGGSLPPGYKATFLNEALLIAFGTLSGGELYNYRQEGRGSAPLIDNVVPVRELKSHKGAGGYENNFPFHCESAWHRKRPHYLILYGVRENADAKTLAYSSKDLLSSDYPLDGLTDPERFRLKAPELYIQMQNEGIPMGTPEFSDLPPVQIYKDKYKLNVNFNGTLCRDMETVELLSKFEDYIESKMVGTIISHGSALLLNNDITCHTRTGYTPLFDGKDRWFLRAYFRRDLWKYDSNVFKEIGGQPDDYQELRKLDWIDDDLTLTSAFTKFMYDPQEFYALPDAQKRLAVLAFQLTPIPGHRIM